MYIATMKPYLDFVDEEKRHISFEYKLCTTSFLDEGGYYYEQSVVGYEYHHNDFHAYLSGYKECANYLKQYMVQEYDTLDITVRSFRVVSDALFIVVKKLVKSAVVMLFTRLFPKTGRICNSRSRS